MSHEPRDETEVPAPEAGSATEQKSSGRVVELKVVKPRVAESPAIEKLEEALALARAGEFRCVMVVGLLAKPDAMRVMWSTGASDMEKIAAFEIAATRLVATFGATK